MGELQKRADRDSLQNKGWPTLWGQCLVTVKLGGVTGLMDRSPEGARS